MEFDEAVQRAQSMVGKTVLVTSEDLVPVAGRVIDCNVEYADAPDGMGGITRGRGIVQLKVELIR